MGFIAALVLLLFAEPGLAGQGGGEVVTKPKAVTLDRVNGVSMKLVVIPAGKFLMGSPQVEKDRSSNEGPQREVTITRPFYMGVHEVTKGQFAQFISSSGYRTDAEKEGKAWGSDGSKWEVMAGHSWRKTGFQQGDDHPVVNVSYNDAVAFCDWLSRKTGRKVTLPTEAQWEYACRAGTTTAYPWGNSPDDGKGWANAADQAAKRQFPRWTTFNWDDGFVFTGPVGRFRPNGFGLHDMIGNVWEWCSDWYADSYANAKNQDPIGPDSGSARVLRGGSWFDPPAICRSANRAQGDPAIGADFFGFRVAVELK
jgi:formylglycine-generating enzyme required for sulfatase activity